MSSRKSIPIICSFSGDAYDSLKPKERRDYQMVRAAVLADGRFSAFDASATSTSARIFDRLGEDKTVELYQLGYPWLGVRLAPPTLTIVRPDLIQSEEA